MGGGRSMRSTLRGGPAVCGSCMHRRRGRHLERVPRSGPSRLRNRLGTMHKIGRRAGSPSRGRVLGRLRRRDICEALQARPWCCGKPARGSLRRPAAESHTRSSSGRAAASAHGETGGCMQRMGICRCHRVVKGWWLGDWCGAVAVWRVWLGWGTLRRRERGVASGGERGAGGAAAVLQDTLRQGRQLLLLSPQLRRLLAHRRVQLRALLYELCSGRTSGSVQRGILGSQRKLCTWC